MSAGTTVQFQGHQDAPECSQYFASCNRSLLSSSSEMAWHEIEAMSISDPVSKESVRPTSTDLAPGLPHYILYILNIFSLPSAIEQIPGLFSFHSDVASYPNRGHFKGCDGCQDEHSY
jgi:hypothetical protein